MIELTPEQAEVISGDDNRFVVASPGTGKTRVALAKIIRSAIALAESEQSVLVLTFSNSAKDELSKRVDENVGPELRSHIEIQTLHAFVLQELVGKFGLISPAKRDLRLTLAGGTVYDKTIESIAGRFGLTNENVKYALKNCRRKSDGAPFDRALRLSGTTEAVVLAFWDMLLSKGYVDHANALYVGNQILASNGWIRDGLSARYPAIVVDEFQDCSDVQLDLLKHLHDGGSKLFLVGDLYQCVFGFTGADPAVSLDFVSQIGAETFPLTGTHRCPKEIVALAERVFKRDMVSVGDAFEVEGTVTVVSYDTAFNALCALIKQCDEERISRSQIAFACAQHELITQLVLGLSEIGISATVGKTRYDDADWYAALTDAMLMVDPPAEVADIAEFTTVIIGIVERFSTAAENLQALGTAIRTAVEEILPSWETLPDLPIAGLTKAIVERVEQVLRVSRVIRAVDCTEILDHVAAAGASYESKPDAKLRKSAVMSRLRPVNSIRGYTFQGIKGLEFEGVALLFCSSPYLPYKYEKDLWGSLQLFYVGITRVKRHLVLHMPSPSKFAPIVAARIASRDVIGSDPPLWMQE